MLWKKTILTILNWNI